MSEANIGSPPSPLAKRDAIHFAVIPMVAGVDMGQGCRVAITNGKAYPALTTYQETIGIVDPFLQSSVREGQMFWLFMNPGTVHSIRHDWSHPAIPEDSSLPSRDPEGESQRWLEAYAEINCPYYEGNAYQRFMERVRRGEIFHSGTDLHSVHGIDNPELLFHHLSVVLGRPVKSSDFEYGCSC